MFLTAILGYNKKTGKETLAIGGPRETHGDVYMRVAGRLDINDISGFVDSETLKYYNRKTAARIAAAMSGNKDADFESSEYHIGLRYNEKIGI
jgi:hypothetical protein